MYVLACERRYRSSNFAGSWQERQKREESWQPTRKEEEGIIGILESGMRASPRAEIVQILRDSGSERDRARGDREGRKIPFRHHRTRSEREYNV